MPADDEPALTFVGVAHTPYSTPEDAPHQGFSVDAEASIDIFDEYAEALVGLEDVLRRCEEKAPPFTAGMNSTTPTRTTFGVPNGCIK